MKKALIIANMLFASATVFGMDQQSFVSGESPAVNQSGNVTQIDSAKDACQELLNAVQSKLDETDLLSKDARLLYRKLKFEDIWKEIEQILFSDSSNENNSEHISSNLEASFKQIIRGSKDDLQKFFSTEEIGKRKAKFFYKQVLGDSELGSDLYDKAVKSIDSTKYIQCPDRGSAFNSYANYITDEIKCYYHKEDDLVETLIHETGHILDAHYRRIKKFGRAITSKFETWQVFQNKYVGKYATKLVCPKENQIENVSIFFESLLETNRFKGNLIKNSSMGYRIWEIYMDLVNKSLVCELMASYNQDQLNDLILKGQWSQNDYKIIISKLEKHDRMKIHIDSLRKLSRVLYPKYEPLNGDKENLWRNLLQKLESQGYVELSRLFRGIDKGKSELKSYGRGSVMSEFVFKKGSEEIRETLPELDGIDWEKIKDIATFKEYNINLDEDKENLWKNLLQNLDDKGYTSLSQLLRGIENGKSRITSSSWRSTDVVNRYIFSKGSDEKEVLLPQLEGIDWKDIFHLAQKRDFYTKAYTFFESPLISAYYLLKQNNATGLLDIDNHTGGKYNSLRLIKEKGYFDALEKGESLPIEEVMENLTKPAEPLNLTEKSIEEFFEFLRTGKLVS